MISAPVVHASSAFLAHLFAPAARSLCLGCFAALAVRALRVKSISGRLAVWKMVLYAALAMPLLGLILPPLSLQLPSAVARFVPQRATVATALRQSGDTSVTGAFEPGAFPITPFRVHPELPLSQSDADVHPMSTTRTSRADVLPANNSILPKAAPIARESDASPAMAAKIPRRRSRGLCFSPPPISQSLSFSSAGWCSGSFSAGDSFVARDPLPNPRSRTS